MDPSNENTLINSQGDEYIDVESDETKVNPGSSQEQHELTGEVSAEPSTSNVFIAPQGTSPRKQRQTGEAFSGPSTSRETYVSETPHDASEEPSTSYEANEPEENPNESTRSDDDTDDEPLGEDLIENILRDAIDNTGELSGISTPEDAMLLPSVEIPLELKPFSIRPGERPPVVIKRFRVPWRIAPRQYPPNMPRRLATDPRPELDLFHNEGRPATIWT